MKMDVQRAKERHLALSPSRFGGGGLGWLLQTIERIWKHAYWKGRTTAERAFGDSMSLEILLTSAIE